MTQGDLDLPKGWVECRLGDVVNYGATLKVEPKDIPPDAWVLELEDIEKDTSKILQRATHAERRSKSTKNRFVSGDVLYGKLRPYLNKVVIAGENGYCTTEIIPLSPPPGLDGRYLFYSLKQPRFLEYVSAVSHGLNMPRLGTEAGRLAPFVLAPLAEQERIADKLDTLLARVDACRERLERIPGILKRFRQSVLAAAISGKLTEEWRAERGQSPETRNCALGEASIEVPASWRLESLSSIIDPKRPLCYGVVQPGPEDSSGVPLIRVQDMENGAVLVEQLRTISAEIDQQYRRSRVQEGDLLISVVGTIGRTAVVPKNVGANIARAIARVACKAGVDSRWVNTWLSSSPLQWWLVSSANEVARKTLNLADLAGAPIVVPPEDEQREIVRRVESLLTIADRAQDQYERGREQLDRMSPALLDQAFRGKLVPQDPSDEPAYELLARLRALPPATMNQKRIRQSTIEMKPAMKSTDKDKIKAVILTLKKNSFSFEELRADVGGDYEWIKDALFELLQESDPVVRQVFDKKAKAMQFVRVKS